MRDPDAILAELIELWVRSPPLQLQARLIFFPEKTQLNFLDRS
jgi:hypothetical protein